MRYSQMLAYACLSIVWLAFASLLLVGCSESAEDHAKDACHANLGIWHAADWNGSDAWCDFGR